MYLTVTETAEYLGMPVHQVESYIHSNRIRAVYDGEQYLVNQHQFTHYFEQLEILKEQIAEWKNEPMPPDRDIKDED